MATYNLVIDIDQAHVKQFNTEGWKLCFAAGVAPADGGTPDFHVVAYTVDEVAAHVTIHWQEEYAIAATDSKFMDGAMLKMSTDMTPIAFGQSYTLPSDFSDGVVNNDSNAPQNGFLFQNQAPQAAAILYKKIWGQFRPIYISKDAPFGPGTETLIPALEAAVWFTDQTETSSMISSVSSSVLTIDFSTNQSRTAEVKFDGQWTVVSDN